MTLNKWIVMLQKLCIKIGFSSRTILFMKRSIGLPFALHKAFKDRRREWNCCDEKKSPRKYPPPEMFNVRQTALFEDAPLSNCVCLNCALRKTLTLTARNLFSEHSGQMFFGLRKILSKGQSHTKAVNINVRFTTIVFP